MVRPFLSIYKLVTGGINLFFDTHTHLNVRQFKDDAIEVLERALDSGVTHMIMVGFDDETIPKALEFAEKYEHVYAAVGWHPVDAIDFNDEKLAWIEELASHEKVVAIGETGLDYHWDKSPKDVQKDAFRKQIDLAKRVQLPLIIHNRNATDDCYAILKEEGASEIGGVMHCFSDEADYVQPFIDLNFYISLGGPVTFKNAKAPKEVAKAVPLEKLLIETDAPFLAPHPYRGKRNEPAHVKLVAEAIADLRGMSIQDVAKATMDNAYKLFQLNK